MPELTPAYEEHLRRNGEALGHVFMGDVARFAIGSRDVRLLDFFESELATGDAYAAELIALGFCENLQADDGAVEVLLPMMGSRLSTLTKTYLWK